MGLTFDVTSTPSAAVDSVCSDFRLRLQLPICTAKPENSVTRTPSAYRRMISVFTSFRVDRAQSCFRRNHDQKHGDR
jgi:hypothetical protein